jgi:pimeloyl-ACP methyl ester carboxylesterase
MSYIVHYTELEAKACGKDPAEAKVWYYGVSYGTVIGQTLAALHPQRLGRIILDANVNGVEHYQGFVPSAVEETDDAFAFFFNYCYEAGPELCLLAANATSALSIENRYRAFLRKLANEPIAVKGDTTIITQSLLNSAAFKAMYDPNAFYALARQIVGLEKGDTSELPVFTQAIGVPSGTWASSDSNSTEATGNDVLQLITCVDAAGRYVLKSFGQYRDAVEDLLQKSTYGGATLSAGNVLLCNGLEITPPESQLFPGFQTTDTNVPILFIGTTGDPVTPVASAHRMSELFPGSAVLTQTAPGHSFQALQSDCTNAYAAAYFKNGSLPEKGTICGLDVTPTDVFSAGAERYKKIAEALISGSKL